MDELFSQAKDRIVMVKSVKSRPTESEVATNESEGQISTDYKSTKYESETDEGSRMKKPLVDEEADKVNL